MMDYTKPVGPPEEALARLDAMLGGLADEYEHYRSTEELLGGISAIREKLHEVWRCVTVRATDRTLSLAAEETSWPHSTPPHLIPPNCMLDSIGVGATPTA